MISEASTYHHCARAEGGGSRSGELQQRRRTAPSVLDKEEQTNFWADLTRSIHLHPESSSMQA